MRIRKQTLNWWVVLSTAWTFPNCFPPLSTWFFENWSNLGGKTGVLTASIIQKLCSSCVASLVLFWISLSIWIDTTASQVVICWGDKVQQRGKDTSVCYIIIKMRAPKSFFFHTKVCSSIRNKEKLIYFKYVMFNLCYAIVQLMLLRNSEMYYICTQLSSKETKNTLSNRVFEKDKYYTFNSWINTQRMSKYADLVINTKVKLLIWSLLKLMNGLDL